MNQKKSILKDELLGLIKNFDVVIIDVRENDEFCNGHISDAINITVSELAERCGELSINKPIVTYCGKGGGRSEKGANILNENGKLAFWLEGGYSEWIKFN